MQNRAIPFRPRLEGSFRGRFYEKAALITTNTTSAQIEELIVNEVHWVEKECFVNLAQRKKYRAVWLLLRDLIRAAWKAEFHQGVLEMHLPSLDADMHIANNQSEAKNTLRSWMQDSRIERLLTYKDFINQMEHPAGNKKPINFLIADGEELAARMERVCNHEDTINNAIRPYLQLVEESDRDQITGLKLSDIWRYFRLTWSTPAETTPGRTMQYLIRDAAHENHAVIGIASLENCAVQITCRDNFIGWNPSAFKEMLLCCQDLNSVTRAFEKLLEYLEDGISGIDYADLCAQSKVECPDDLIFSQLNPIILAIGSLTLFPDTLLYKAAQAGEFDETTELEKLIELKTFLEHVNTNACVWSHYSTSMGGIQGPFPENKERWLKEIQYEIDNFDEDKYRLHRNSVRTV